MSVTNSTGCDMTSINGVFDAIDSEFKSNKLQ